MRRLAIAAATLSLLGLNPAIGEELTVTLSVPGMSCASCPFIVKGALTEVAGVTDVEARIDDRSATVTFDDAVVSLDVLLQATANAGYPSSLVETPGT